MSIPRRVGRRSPPVLIIGVDGGDQPVGRVVGVGHLGGQLMIRSFSFACGIIASLKLGGTQIAFGAMNGTATIFMRLNGLPGGACY